MHCSKKNLRTAMLLKRKKMLKALVNKKSHSLCQKLRNESLYQNAKKVAFYYPIHQEVDLGPLIQDALKNKKIVVLPSINKEKKELEFHTIKNIKTDRKMSRLNTMEPIRKKGKEKNIDLIFVPGIVFDKNRNRIGYGKGYYDRFLRKKKSKTVGIAYDFQLVESIPAEAHDVTLDKVITEKRII